LRFGANYSKPKW